MSEESGFKYWQTGEIATVSFSNGETLTEQQTIAIALTKIASELTNIRFALEQIDNTIAGK